MRKVSCILNYILVFFSLLNNSSNFTMRRNNLESSNIQLAKWFDCKDKPDKNFAHPSNCEKFITCLNSIAFEIDCPHCPQANLKPHRLDCPGEILYYNNSSDTCEWPTDVKCKIESESNNTIRNVRNSSPEPKQIDWFKCNGKKSGNHSHPQTCTKYLTCKNNKAYETSCETCPDGVIGTGLCPNLLLSYNPETDKCEGPTVVKCVEKRDKSWFKIDTSESINKKINAKQRGRAIGKIKTKKKESYDVLANSTLTDKEFICRDKVDDNYQHPHSCEKYVSCKDEKRYEYECPPCPESSKGTDKCPEGKMHFNYRISMCDLPNKAQCNKKKQNGRAIRLIKEVPERQDFTTDEPTPTSPVTRGLPSTDEAAPTTQQTTKATTVGGVISTKKFEPSTDEATPTSPATTTKSTTKMTTIITTPSTKVSSTLFSTPVSTQSTIGETPVSTQSTVETPNSTPVSYQSTIGETPNSTPVSIQSTVETPNSTPVSTQSTIGEIPNSTPVSTQSTIGETPVSTQSTVETPNSTPVSTQSTIGEISNSTPVSIQSTVETPNSTPVSTQSTIGEIPNSTPVSTQSTIGETPVSIQSTVETPNSTPVSTQSTIGEISNSTPVSTQSTVETPNSTPVSTQSTIGEIPNSTPVSIQSTVETPNSTPVSSQTTIGETPVSIQSTIGETPVSTQSTVETPNSTPVSTQSTTGKTNPSITTPISSPFSTTEKTNPTPLPPDNSTCDPRNCLLKGYCRSYKKCDALTNKWITIQCGDGLFWNPKFEAKIIGGTCDRWDNLDEEIKQIYNNDPLCNVYPSDCFFEEKEPCSSMYLYHANGTDYSHREELPCPPGLLWSQKIKTCSFCESIVNSETQEPCECEDAYLKT